MASLAKNILLLSSFLLPTFGIFALHIGVNTVDITPPIGTPSAGYSDRKGVGMEGVADPLLATALFIDNGEKQIVLCSVDHLGFTYEMVQEIIRQVHLVPHLAECEIFIASSHTHSGGGAYMNIPYVGEMLAGAYSPEITKFYEKQTAKAIVGACQDPKPAKIGIGYGNIENLSKYRALWPTDIAPLSDVAVIKASNLDDTPLAVLFNYPLHPTILKSQNRLFSSDFVGYARKELQSLLGEHIQALYFNGAQGEIVPIVHSAEDAFASCKQTGETLGKAVMAIYDAIEPREHLKIATQKHNYTFTPQATPFGLTLPIPSYPSEMNVIVFNDIHAFITIPGELSTLYDRHLKHTGNNFGYEHVSIFGLTNDAHGYILLPDSWKHKTSESALSFGGEYYGETIKTIAETLLKEKAPKKKDSKENDNNAFSKKLYNIGDIPNVIQCVDF